MEIQKTIAKNIRDTRERKRLTLDAASKLTGVSRSMLAQMEKGEVNPTISILWKIANGYKVSFTSLVSSGGGPLLIRDGDVTPLVEDGGRYINMPAFPFQEDRQFETYRIEIREDGHLEARPHLEGAEEYITMFAGEAEICAGDESWTLRDGDSLRFKADVPHSYKNVGAGTALLSMLIYYGP